jgi:subtilisin-like proprotein convertase family protein
MSKRTLNDYFSKNTNKDDNQPTSSKNTKTSNTQNSSISINVSK